MTPVAKKLYEWLIFEQNIHCTKRWSQSWTIQAFHDNSMYSKYAAKTALLDLRRKGLLKKVNRPDFSRKSKNAFWFTLETDPVIIARSRISWK